MQLFFSDSVPQGALESELGPGLAGRRVPGHRWALGSPRCGGLLAGVQVDVELDGIGGHRAEVEPTHDAGDRDDPDPTGPGAVMVDHYPASIRMVPIRRSGFYPQR